MDVERQREAEETQERMRGLTERDKVIMELLETEKTYTGHLGILASLYLAPARQQRLSLGLSEQDMRTIFINCEKLLSAQQVLLSNIEQAGASINERIGQVYNDSLTADLKRQYTLFVTSQDEAEEMVTSLSSSSEAFIAFCQSRMAQPECKGQQLNSLLIKPLQRITRYPLLFKSIIKHTEASHGDLAALEKLNERMQTVVAEINEVKRDAENLRRAKDLDAEIEWGEKMERFRSAVNPHRRFVRDGKLRRVKLKDDDGKGEDSKSGAGTMMRASTKKEQERWCILFSDVFMVTSRKGQNKQCKLKLLLPLDSVTVLSEVHVKARSHCFQVSFDRDPKAKFLFAAETLEDKLGWVFDLEPLIVRQKANVRQSVRLKCYYHQPNGSGEQWWEQEVDAQAPAHGGTLAALVARVTAAFGISEPGCAVVIRYQVPSAAAASSIGGSAGDAKADEWCTLFSDEDLTEFLQKEVRTIVVQSYQLSQQQQHQPPPQIKPLQAAATS